MPNNRPTMLHQTFDLLAKIPYFKAFLRLSVIGFSIINVSEIVLLTITGKIIEFLPSIALCTAFTTFFAILLRIWDKYDGSLKK